MKLAVFDCDGTLIDSQVNIIRAMESSFTRHALPEMLELFHEEVQGFYPAEPHRDWKGREAAAARRRARAAAWSG